MLPMHFNIGRGANVNCIPNFQTHARADGISIVHWVSRQCGLNCGSSAWRRPRSSQQPFNSMTDLLGQWHLPETNSSVTSIGRACPKCSIVGSSVVCNRVQHMGENSNTTKSWSQNIALCKLKGMNLRRSVPDNTMWWSGVVDTQIVE